MLSEDALLSWWERTTPESRRLLETSGAGPLAPELALTLWHEAGYLPVVEPHRADATMHRLEWRLAPEVAAFVAERAASSDDSPHRVA